jgi:hypothetical protein
MRSPPCNRRHQHSGSALPLHIAERRASIVRLIETETKRHELAPELVHAVVFVESAYDPAAIGASSLLHPNLGTPIHSGRDVCSQLEPRRCDGIVLLTTAFRVECAIHCFNSLNALGRFRHGTRDCEVVRLTLQRKRVSAGRKAEVGILWPNHKHLAIFD